MDTSTLIVIIIIIGIVALMFYSLHANGQEEQNAKENPNDDLPTEEQQIEEVRDKPSTEKQQLEVMVDKTEQNTIVKNTQVERLREKSSQLGTVQWILDILLVIDAICGIWLTSEFLPKDSSAIFIIAIIIGAVIAIYVVNIWATTKQELCKGQAEILRKLEKMEK